MMEIEDKLGVLGDSSPQQTHLCESGDAIEFSNICLCSTTDATSTDPINRRNELLRTYNSPRSDASRYSCNSLLSSEHFVFKHTQRNFGAQTRTLVFKGWHSINRELFLILKIIAKPPPCVATLSCLHQAQPTKRLHSSACIVTVVIYNHLHQKCDRQWLHPIVSE